MHPLDIDTTPHWQNALQGLPFVGAAVAAIQDGGNRVVELWHLIVALLGVAVTLGLTFGSIIYYQARQQASLEGSIALVQRDISELRNMDAFVRRRQELNEDRISKLETSAALVTEFESRMVREHADIYLAIRKKQRE